MELHYDKNIFQELEYAQTYYAYLCDCYNEYKLDSERNLHLWIEDHKLDYQAAYDFAVDMMEIFKNLCAQFYKDVLNDLRKQSVFNIALENELKKIVGWKKYKEYLQRYEKRSKKVRL